MSAGNLTLNPEQLARMDRFAYALADALSDADGTGENDEACRARILTTLARGLGGAATLFAGGNPALAHALVQVAMLSAFESIGDSSRAFATIFEGQSRSVN